MTDKRKADSGLDESELTHGDHLIYLKERKEGGNKRNPPLSR